LLLHEALLHYHPKTYYNERSATAFYACRQGMGRAKDLFRPGLSAYTAENTLAAAYVPLT